MFFTLDKVLLPEPQMSGSMNYKTDYSYDCLSLRKENVTLCEPILNLSVHAELYNSGLYLKTEYVV